MKYYSVVTKKFYDAEQDLLNAEEAAQKAADEAKHKEEILKAKRAERAKELESARSEMLKAANHYEKLLSEFIRDYKSYHSTISVDDISTLLHFWF